MRRPGPRPIAGALDAFRRAAEPATLLARVQGCWPTAVGPAVAREAQPVSERDGVVTVACSSGAWAQELELLAPDVVRRLNEALGATSEGPVAGLRARVDRLP